MSELPEAQGQIAELRTIVVDGFAKTNSRFDGLEHRFDGLEHRFDGLEHRFDGLEHRFGSLERRFDGLELRFDNLEVRFDNLELRVEGLQGQVDFIALTVARHDEAIAEIDMGMRSIHGIVERIEQRMNGHEQRIERLEDRA